MMPYLECWDKITLVSFLSTCKIVAERAVVLGLMFHSHAFLQLQKACQNELGIVG